MSAALLVVYLYICVSDGVVALDQLVLLVSDAIEVDFVHQDPMVDSFVGSAEVSAEDDSHVVVLEGLCCVVVYQALDGDSGVVLHASMMLLQEYLVFLDVLV